MHRLAFFEWKFEQMNCFLYPFGLVFCILAYWIVGKFKPSRYQKELSQMIVFVAIMMSGYCFSYLSGAEAAVIAGQRMILVGNFFVPYYFMSIYFTFCRIDFSKWKLEVMNLFTILLAAFCVILDWKLHLFSCVFVPAANHPIILVKGTLFRNLCFFQSTFYLMMILYATVICFRKFSKRRMVQMFVLMLTMSVPLFLNLVDLVDDTQYGFSPIGFTLSIIIILVLVLLVNIYDLNEAAKAEAASALKSALITFSYDGSFQSCTPLAIKLFPQLEKLSVNEAMDGEEFAEINAMKTREQTEFHFEGSTYECEVRTMKYGIRRFGTMLILNDVTTHRNYVGLMERYQNQLKREVSEKTKHIRTMQQHIVISMADIIENRDGNTGGHVKRTSAVIKILTDYLVARQDSVVTKEFADIMIRTAPMHDFGKLAIADSVLCKNGRLTDEEYEIMKSHTTIGGKIVNRVLKDVEEENVLKICKNIALYHHEKWDGTGYPEQLCGEQIPLEARIMAIADVYDALVSKRCYKEPMSFEKAYEIMMNGFGTQFDPALKECFDSCLAQIEDYYSQHR